MPKGLTSGMFNEGILMKQFGSHFKFAREYLANKINLPRQRNETKFWSFSTFQTLDYSISQMFKQILVDSFEITIYDHQANVPSFTDMNCVKRLRQ